MSLRKVDSLHLSTTHGPCEIQLMVGDITELSLDEKVDLLIVSAFPNNYNISTRSLIKSLYEKFHLSVENLAREKDMDLRTYFSCWLSKPLPKDLPFSRLACFEKRSAQMTPVEQIGDMFRGFMPIFNSQDTTVITPLLGTGQQHFPDLFVLKRTVECACHWMKVGLPLKCLKIVLFDKDPYKKKETTEECIKEFAKLKTKWEVSRIFQMLKPSHDIFISHSPRDFQTAMMLKSALVTFGRRFKVFCEKTTKKEDDILPEHVLSAMYGCKRVLVILTQFYLESKDCLDEFNIALCLKRNAKEMKLIPLCLEKLQNLPPVIGNVQYMDCSLDHEESLTEKFDEVSEKIITELILIKPKQQFIAKSVQAKNKYDIFVSYPTKNAEVMKVVYEILHKHNPQWNIFYDKLELKTGSNWQQSIYDALEVTTCCIILVSPAYFESAMCQEEFNIVVAKCISEEEKNQPLLIPICIIDVESIPDWFGQLNIIDARESLLVPTMEKLAAQLHLSFKNGSIWKDFHWLITKEMKKRISVKDKTVKFREHLFKENYKIEKQTVVPKCQTPKWADACSVLFCFAPNDTKFAASLMNILLDYLPRMEILLFSKSHQDRLSLLNQADHIIMFVSAEYISTAKGLEELTICFNRQRQAKHRFLHFACTAEIPDCLSYLQILPYSIVFSDPHMSKITKKYPENTTLVFENAGIQGTFTYARYEVAALKKFALDIVSSFVEGSHANNNTGNLLNIFRIQRKKCSAPLNKCLVPLP